jgi:hypothetical protein
MKVSKHSYHITALTMRHCGDHDADGIAILIYRQ